QLAALFVWNEVIRIVGPCARIAEWAEHCSGNHASRRRPVRAVIVARGAREHSTDVFTRERSSGAGWPFDRRVGIDFRMRRIESRDEGLDLVVAERPEQFR